MQILLAEAAGIVRRQDDLDPVVDIEDLRVVIHFVGGERDARQKPPGFGEIAEVITLADRVAVLDLAPAFELAQRRLPRRPDQPVDHAALHPSWLASEPAPARGQAGPARRCAGSRPRSPISERWRKAPSPRSRPSCSSIWGRW